jgi:non-specific protein-tyrosine kinase
MQFLRGRSTPLIDAPGEASAAPKADEQQHPGAAGALVADRSRAWLLPGGGEMFRSVYTRTSSDASEVLGVTSAIAGEGKSTVSLGLAVTAAQDFPDRQVLLVETDLQTPTLANDFGIDPHPGLVDYLLDDESLGATYRSTLLENLHLLPSGGPFNNSGRLLRSRRMAEAIDAMRETYDLVVLDLDGLLVNSDTIPLTDLTDGVIVVVRAGVTPTALVNKAARLVDESRLRGVILNDTRSVIPRWVRRLCGV